MDNYSDMQKDIIRREYGVVLENIERYGRNGIGYDYIFLDKYDEFLHSDEACIKLYNEHVNRLAKPNTYHIQSLMCIACGLVLIGVVAYFILKLV